MRVSSCVVGFPTSCKQRFPHGNVRLPWSDWEVSLCRLSHWGLNTRPLSSPIPDVSLCVWCSAVTSLVVHPLIHFPHLFPSWSFLHLLHWSLPQSEAQVLGNLLCHQGEISLHSGFIEFFLLLLQHGREDSLLEAASEQKWDQGCRQM